jgi:hypothetical protein
MTDAALHWFEHHGGAVHQNIKLKINDEYGCHFVSTSKLENDTVVCSCPFNLTLSYLNGLSDPPTGVRSLTNSNVSSKLIGKVESNIIATFLLAEERLKGDASFWAEYIKLLPTENGLATPLWFEADDLAWLRGTNLYSSAVSESQTAVGLRKSMYEEAWKAGIAALEAEGIDTKPFTW